MSSNISSTVSIRYRLFVKAAFFIVHLLSLLHKSTIDGKFDLPSCWVPPSPSSRHVITINSSMYKKTPPRGGERDLPVWGCYPLGNARTKPLYFGGSPPIVEIPTGKEYTQVSLAVKIDLHEYHTEITFHSFW